MDGTELDVLVLGATGFTGSIIATYLSKSASFKWGVAGRSKEKLQELINSLKNNGEPVPSFIVDVNDTDLLRAATSRTKILLNCVGPYTTFGDQVVESCIKSRTHYIDLSAEIHHILKLYQKYHSAAEDANVLIIPSCGFASIPAASGFMYLDSQFEGTLSSVDCYVELGIPKRSYVPRPGNCLVHYGTWASLVCSLTTMKTFIQLKQKIFPEALESIPQEVNRGFFHRNHGKLWYPYPGPDQNVIEFSERYLHKNHNKRPVNCKLYTTMPHWVHFIIVPLMFMYYYLCYFNFFSKLLKRYPRFFTAGYMSHKGPSEKMMKDTTYCFTFLGKGWEAGEDMTQTPNKTLKCKVSSSNVYSATALAMISSAETLLNEQSSMPKGGVVNVGAAFCRTNLVERLLKYNISYEIVS